jgi:transforming growth factor-beta-induced protein
MNRLFSVGILFFLAASLLFGSGARERESMEKTPTIVEIAVNDGRFETLVTALQAAGLVDTLSGDGPFTVFAPTDDAFAALPAGTVEGLLNDIPALTQVLLYHVSSGKVMASDVVKMNEASMVSGEMARISVMGDKVMINDANVVITDIVGSNGVIHVIDRVILPAQATASAPMMSAPSDIVDTAVADGRFTTLVAAVQAAGLVDTLRSTGPFTVFAPTDAAFAKLPAGTIEALLNDIPKLSNILLYHVLTGSVGSAEVVSMSSATTVAAQDVQFQVRNGKVYVNDAEVIITDIQAANGVIHVIDTVILPPA